MKGACALVFNEDRAFISFASLTRTYCTFCGETEIPISLTSGDFFSYFRRNSELINRKIKEAEKRFSFRVENVFIELPQGLGNAKVVRDVVPLKRRKRIGPRDISFAKKYIENKFLDWDDYCLHNIAIQYEVEGSCFDEPPLGVCGKKIVLKNFLVWIKDKFYRETEDILDSLDRHFAGFVYPAISIYSCSFNSKSGVQAVIHCGYGMSSFTVRNKEGFIFSQASDFGLKKIYRELSRRFLLSDALAGEVFERYVSFKETPYFKEITIKREDAYVNISTQAINVFVREYIRNEIITILQQMIPHMPGEDSTLSLIGRFNNKKGFYGLLKDCLPYSLKRPIERTVVSSSFGCLQYGLYRFLERDHLKQKSLLWRIINMYREYF